MRCAIYLAVIGSAFTVLSSLPAAATISLSGELNALADTNINSVIVSDPESDVWPQFPRRWRPARSRPRRPASIS